MATPDTADEIVERWNPWYLDLLQLVEPLGDGVAARFKPLTPMRPDEQMTVAYCAPLAEKPNLDRVCHAVCMYRLGEVFKQIGPVMPEDDEAEPAPPPPTVQRPALREDVEASYRQHVENTLEAKDQRPTRAEDKKWRETNGVTRARQRSLRNAYGAPAQVEGDTPRQK